MTNVVSGVVWLHCLLPRLRTIAAQALFRSSQAQHSGLIRGVVTEAVSAALTKHDRAILDSTERACGCQRALRRKDSLLVTMGYAQQPFAKWMAKNQADFFPVLE